MRSGWVWLLVCISLLLVVGCEGKHKVVLLTDPQVEISSPADSERVGGVVSIQGTASEVSGFTITEVEVSFDSGAWQTATGTDTWSFDWDTTGVSDGSHTIAARATSSSGEVSPVVEITVVVDNTPPTLIEAYPGRGWTGVRTGTNIYLVFTDGPMDRSSVEGGFSLTTGGTPVSGRFYWRVRSTDNAEVCIFVPDDYLADESTYTIDFTPLPDDMAGNQLTGFSSLSFDTADCTEPSVSTRTPDVDAVVVASSTTQITVQFDEDMDTANGYMELTDLLIDEELFSDNTGNTALNWMTDNRTLVLDLTTAGITLEEGRCYGVSVNVSDDAYNWTSTNINWNFYTQGSTSDTTPPSVVDITPANGATDVTPRRLVHILFSEAIDPSSIDASDITITDGGDSVAYQYRLEGNRLTILPDRVFTGNVVLTIEANSLNDLASNSGPASNYTCSFSVTDDTTAPTVSWVLPADGTTGLRNNWDGGGVMFSERMDTDALPADALTIVGPSGAPVKGLRISPHSIFDGILGGVSVLGIEATSKYAGLLYWDEEVTFTITLSSEVKDLAGNSLGTPLQWTVTTRADSTVDHTPFVAGRPLTETFSIDVWKNGNINFDIYVRVDDEDSSGEWKWEEIGTGNNSRTQWTGTLANAPVQPGSLSFSAGGQSASDDGYGGITGNASGTIDYTTGDYDITWSTAPATDVSVNVFYTYKPTVYGETLGTGDGSQTQWTGTLANKPANRAITPGTFRLKTVWGGSDRYASDDGYGVITGDASGTIDYTTGDYNITWNSPPDSGESVTALFETGLEVEVSNGTSTWYLGHRGWGDYEYKTPEPPDSLPGTYTDPNWTPSYGWNTFTFTITDSGGNTVTFTKEVYIPDPNDTVTPSSPDINESTTDTTPTFTWTAGSIPVEAKATSLFVIVDIDNDIFWSLHTADATQLTLPDELPLPYGRSFWVVANFIESAGGDKTSGIGISMILERPFWITNNSLGSITGTMTPSGGTDREYVFVAVFDSANWDSDDNQPAGDPVSWTIAKFDSANDNYTYAFYNLPDGTYYVWAFMDLNSNMSPDTGEPTGFYDNDDGSPNTSESITITIGSGATGIDFSLLVP